MRFLWSVNNNNDQPNKITQNSLSVYRTISGYFFVTVYMVGGAVHFGYKCDRFLLG